MADELIHSGICGETLWSNSCTSRNMFGSSSSLCSSSTISDLGGAFGWSNNSWFDNMKTPMTDECLLLHQDVHIINDSLDSTISEWNETLFRQTNGNSHHQGSYPIILQDDDFNLNMNNNYHHQQQSLMDFSPKTYVRDQESSNTPTFNNNYGLQQKQCEVLPTNYTLNPYTSSFLQDLFTDDTTIIEKPLYDNNFKTNNNMTGFLLRQQSPLAFSDKTSSWNASIAASQDIKAGILRSTQLQVPSPSIGDKFKRTKANIEEGAKKANNEPVFKRPRIETPSHLPTFKVRKEKLGDRITALQQLVSPFGKTDTASVLHEAIEYIKFLHDQVNVLSTPYLKNGSPNQRFQGTDEQEKDLESLGLCLVPLSSTFSLAAEPPTDFWTPTLGGSFRNDKWEAWNGGSHIALACKF